MPRLHGLHEMDEMLDDARRRMDEISSNDVRLRNTVLRMLRRTSPTGTPEPEPVAVLERPRYRAPLRRNLKYAIATPIFLVGMMGAFTAMKQQRAAHEQYVAPAAPVMCPTGWAATVLTVNSTGCVYVGSGSGSYVNAVYTDAISGAVHE